MAEIDRRRVIQRLKAFRGDLPAETHDMGYIERYEELRTIAERAFDTDLSGFAAGPDFMVSPFDGIDPSLIGHARRHFKDKLDTDRLRSTIGQVIAVLDDVPKPTGSAAPIQLAVNVGDGNQYSIALGGRDVSQHVQFTGQAGNVDDLLRALHELGVPPTMIDDLEDALTEAGDSPDARRSAAWRWARGFVGAVASNAAGSSLAQAAPAVVSAVAGFLGPLA